MCFNSCIKPYEFDVRSTSRVLVVDASVTNLEGTQYVRLEYSYSLNGGLPELVSGADVMVIDDQDNETTFQEIEPGLYKPASNFSGIIGRKYQLSIQTPNGEQYQSEEEELLTSAQLDSIYGRFLTLDSESSDGFERGVQFFADLSGFDDQNHNFRFQYEENYEVSVPYPSLYEYNPTTVTIDRREISLRTCYVKQDSQGLLIGTTSGQVNSQLREFPIVFINEDQQELLGRYSLTVQPFRISSEAYQYYKDLKENNESAGSFFDRQKGALTGNIRNVNDASEPVLGYFEVASVSTSLRIFDIGTWKEDGFRANRILTQCVNLLDTVRTADVLSNMFNFDRQLIYNFAETDGVVPGTFYSTETILVPQSCSDCRVYGNLEKPAFWD